MIGLVFGGFGNAAQAHGLAQEMTRLVERFAKIPEPLVEADEIEKIAILARGRIGPAACAVAGQFHEEAFAGGALDVARYPVASIAASGG